MDTNNTNNNKKKLGSHWWRSRLWFRELVAILEHKEEPVWESSYFRENRTDGQSVINTW